MQKSTKKTSQVQDEPTPITERMKHGGPRSRNYREAMAVMSMAIEDAEFVLHDTEDEEERRVLLDYLVRKCRQYAREFGQAKKELGPRRRRTSRR